MGKNKKEHSTQGFTLVELSIVLVVLGLLVGGVLVGRSLIHAAEIRAVGEEYAEWHQAVNAFRLKYQAYPGDMSNATQYWGAINTGGSDGNCSDPVYDYSDGIETCNGDGNGSIYSSWEQHRFWQHLSNAQMIRGIYTGVAGPAGTRHAIIGENAPESKFGGGGWGMADYQTHAGSNYYFAGYYGHSFLFGAQHFIGMPIDKLLFPADAWKIDDKFDDGLPNQGKIVAHWWKTCTTADDNGDKAAEYELTVDKVSCSLIFRDVK